MTLKYTTINLCACDWNIALEGGQTKKNNLGCHFSVIKHPAKNKVVQILAVKDSFGWMATLCHLAGDLH